MTESDNISQGHINFPKQKVTLRKRNRVTFNQFNEFNICPLPTRNPNKYTTGRTMCRTNNVCQKFTCGAQLEVHSNTLEIA